MDDYDGIPEVNESLEGAKYYVNNEESPPNLTQKRGRSSITNPNFDFEGYNKQTTSPRRQINENDSQGQRERQSLCHDAECPLNERNSPKCKLYVKSRLKDKEKHYEDELIFIVDTSYLKKCDGIVKIIQIILSLVMLISLATAGQKDGGILHLPLNWHFRIMLFVLILTILSSITSVLANITNIVSLLPIDWIVFDLVLYSVFSFLYLVGTSLVASAFDFYEKMNSNVAKDTINQLLVSVILGYVCMFCYGLTALVSYRRWKVQYNLYQRKRLIEEDL
ncbi:hypothetical protein SNE40_017747 [Patella caerulea]|uniref:MARVEL domain-containing protein n=1 Tax=Patella caerulea TaxID=87958 RepID=A0AAN8PA98_PATCE